MALFDNRQCQIEYQQVWRDEPARWTITLAPGGRTAIEYAVAIGNDVGKAGAWAG